MAGLSKKGAILGVVALAAVGLIGMAVLGSALQPKKPYMGLSGLSHMKLIGTGISIYRIDHDEMLPVSLSETPSAVGWGERIFPYVKGADVFSDPDERRAIADERERSRPRVSYALNANAVALPNASSTAEFAGRSVLLFEVAGARTGRDSELHSTLRLSPAGDGAAGGLLDCADPEIAPLARPMTGPLAHSGLPADTPTRVKGVARFAFLDRSARSLPPRTVSAGANARATKDAAAPSGGVRPDLPNVARPRAEGAARKSARATFSLR